MGRHLTAQGFTHAPRSFWVTSYGLLRMGRLYTLAIAFSFVRNEGDAWSWILDHLTRTIDAGTPAPSEASESDLLSDCEAVVTAIGQRLGEMHAILMQESCDPAFAPKVADCNDAENWARQTEERIRLAFDNVARLQTWERQQDRERAEMLQGRWRPFSLPFARSRVSA